MNCRKFTAHAHSTGFPLYDDVQYGERLWRFAAGVLSLYDWTLGSIFPRRSSAYRYDHDHVMVWASVQLAADDVYQPATPRCTTRTEGSEGMLWR
jgi:hypothetical protein